MTNTFFLLLLLFQNGEQPDESNVWKLLIGLTTAAFVFLIKLYNDKMREVEKLNEFVKETGTENIKVLTEIGGLMNRLLDRMEAVPSGIAPIIAQESKDIKQHVTEQIANIEKKIKENDK